MIRTRQSDQGQTLTRSVIIHYVAESCCSRDRDDETPPILTETLTVNDTATLYIDMDCSLTRLPKDFLFLSQKSSLGRDRHHSIQRLDCDCLIPMRKMDRSSQYLEAHQGKDTPTLSPRADVGGWNEVRGYGVSERAWVQNGTVTGGLANIYFSTAGTNRRYGLFPHSTPKRLFIPLTKVFVG